MDWLRLHAGLPAHPKVGRLARRLGVDRERALALILRLLCWTAAAKETGTLNGTDPDDIADALCWPGEPAELVDALVAAGWLDRGAEGLAVHEWLDYQGGVFRHRERARKQYRDAKPPGSADTLRADCAQTADSLRAPCSPRTDGRTDGRRPPPARARARDRRQADAADLIALGGHRHRMPGDPDPGMAAALIENATGRRRELVAAIAAHDSGQRSLDAQTEKALRAEIERLDARIVGLAGPAPIDAPEGPPC